MKKPSVLLLYGLDEASQAFEIESTLGLIKAANDALDERGWRVLPLQVTQDMSGPLKPFDPKEWVVFNLCEGEPAQAFYYAKATRVLAEMGFTFTGSEAWSLEETQYKWRMKALMEQAGVPTPKWAVFDRAEDVRFDAFPAIVKPAAEHCSYGITRDSVVMNEAEARRQTARMVSEFKQPALIEEFLDSAEYNVTVWGAGADMTVLGISSMTYDAFSDIHDRMQSGRRSLKRISASQPSAPRRFQKNSSEKSRRCRWQPITRRAAETMGAWTCACAMASRWRWTSTRTAMSAPMADLPTQRGLPA